MPLHIQQQLFDRPTFNVIKTQKEAMNAAARDCGLSRPEIVDKMNDLAERYGIKLVSGNSHGLQIDTLEKWINPSELSRQMPMRVLPVFCAVVGDAEPINIMAQPLDAEVIGPEDRKKLRWANAKLRIRQENKTIRTIEPELFEEI